MTIYYSLFEEKASEPPPNARPLRSPRLDLNAPPRDKLKMALPFSVFYLSVLVGLGRTPLCSFLSLAYSGAQLLYDVFQVQDDFSAFLSWGAHALSLALASPSPHPEEPSAFTAAPVTSAPTSIPGVRRGAPLGDAHLFVSAGLAPVPATGAGALRREFRVHGPGRRETT